MSAAAVSSERQEAILTAPAVRPRRRRVRTRRSSVAILAGLIAFAALQIGAAVVLNLWFPEMIDPNFGNRLASVWQGRTADPAHTHTVIMVGSSRTYFGLYTGELSATLTGELSRPVSVVNASYFGGGPLTDLLTWRRLRREGVRPDLLLIEVTPGYFNDGYPPYEMRAERLPTNHIGWLDLPLLARYRAGTRPTLRRDVALTDANIIYNRRRGIIHTIAPYLQPVAKAGFEDDALTGPGFLPADPTPELRQTNLNEARQEWNYLTTFWFGGRDRATDALRELLASCRESGVRTGLVLMPEGPEFRSWYGSGSWPLFQDRLEQIGREEGAQLVVAREWIDEDDFMDSHHLLPRGAEKFSQRLGSDYILPLLRQQEETRR